MSKIDISQFVKSAQELEKKTGIPASVTLAQLILESSSSTSSNGLSGLARNAKNLFGIKAGSSWNGATYSVNTNEEVNGQNVTVKAKFRKYSSYEDSIEDYGKLISSSRYKANTITARTVEDFIKGIKKSGYATDSNYVEKVENVIKDNDLNKYNMSGSNRTFYDFVSPPSGGTPFTILKNGAKAITGLFGVNDGTDKTDNGLTEIPNIGDSITDKFQSEIKNGFTIVLVLFVIVVMVIFLLKSLDINVGEVVANAKRI